MTNVNVNYHFEYDSEGRGEQITYRIPINDEQKSEILKSGIINFLKTHESEFEFLDYKKYLTSTFFAAMESNVGGWNKKLSKIRKEIANPDFFKSYYENEYSNWLLTEKIFLGEEILPTYDAIKHNNLIMAHILSSTNIFEADDYATCFGVSSYGRTAIHFGLNGIQPPPDYDEGFHFGMENYWIDKFQIDFDKFEMIINNNGEARLQATNHNVDYINVCLRCHRQLGYKWEHCSCRLTKPILKKP